MRGPVAELADALDSRSSVLAACEFDSHQGHFADALKAARRSTIKRFQTGAAIYSRKGELLSIGWSHVPCGRLRATPWSIHAEHHAIRRLNPTLVDEAATIVVVTISQKGNITCGAPCPACEALINKHDLSVIHTH